jgi:putative transposase
MQTRRSLRLPGFDYSQPGVYYICLGTRDGQPLFGERRRGRVLPTELGEFVLQQWRELPRRHPFLRLDSCGLQPTHLHGLLVWRVARGHGIPEAFGQPTRDSLPTVMRLFKAGVTRDWRAHGGEPRDIWQGRYLERVVRNRGELADLRTFIRCNTLFHRLCDRDSW